MKSDPTTREELRVWIINEAKKRQNPPTEREANTIAAAILNVVRTDRDVAGFLKGYRHKQ